MKKLKIKKIGEASFAKMLCAIYALVGVILGVLFIIASVLTGRNDMVFNGVVMIVAYPVLGLVLGWLIAYAYNIASKKIGGVEMEMG